MCAGAPHQSLDLERHPLLCLPLEIISADLRLNDEVAHEHPVQIALGIASADDSASEQPPIDLRRAVGVQPLTRD